MGILLRLSLAPCLLLLASACSDSDDEESSFRYTVSYAGPDAAQPGILQQEIFLGRTDSSRSGGLAFGSGQLEAKPIADGYQLTVAEVDSTVRLRVVCRADAISDGSSTQQATMASGEIYTLSFVTTRASCQRVAP